MNDQLSSSSLGDIEPELYAKRQKVYPREVHGVFAFLRTTAVMVLLGIFYGVPWLRWDGRQAMLFDLPTRKFYVFGLSFWPQDFFYLTGLLIVAALSLFFFTALAGRLWCGYACPQTVWTEVFLWIERKIEGDRPRQIKLDKSPLSTQKILIKGSKHTIWIMFSLWTGFTFVGYFTPILELGHKVLTLATGPWETFWILFYGFATYGNAGWLREQVCIYMCPYARFQSAMFDKDTMTVSYDPSRGEPRGSRKRGSDYRALGLGDCIDCNICVQVCPTGIDIRNGLQYQCIGCASCIDACDDVMNKMNYPKGLIRYTTEHTIEGKPTRVLRPRVLIYAVLLAGTFIGVLYGIAHRIPVALDVIRDRNSLFRETNLGLIENVYTLKILNKDNSTTSYKLWATGIAGLQLLLDQEIIEVSSGQVSEIPTRLQADPVDLQHRSTDIEFHIQSLDDETISATEKARFLGPLGLSK
ncbi:MAG: cytochrome c oxidase accessory protein CcoG [Gammaproteobacteria bacterium]|nr:cytochrome c oxidase accessory protein CcoG [Gammaproteobacteria bacterium]